MIFKIAKNELRNLFYSPVAWFLTVAFMVQCGIFYTNPLYISAKWQDILTRNNPKFKDFGDATLTQNIFLHPDGIFVNVLQNLYLFVPLLSMSLISRDISNGTIKLLYSSPIKIREIVLGKYLSIMIYNLLLVLIVGIFMVTGAFNIHAVDYGLLLSAALGFYLLVCAYSAIGLYMSSLSVYPIVSALGSFIIIFSLGRIGLLWQKVDFVRDLTYFLSIAGRTNKMLVGLITTKDVLYFFVIVYIFVGFTLCKLSGGRESKPWYIKARGYVFIMLSALTIGYISSRPSLTGYWDTTATKSNTLHPNTQKVIKDLGDDPLEVTLYTNLLGNGVNKGLPEGRNEYLSQLWDPYLRFKPDIRFHYVNYYDYDSSMDDGSLKRTFPHKTVRQIAEQMAEGYDVSFSQFQAPETVRSLVNLRPETYRLIMQLKYKGKTTFLRTFDDPRFWPMEQQVAGALKRLLQPAPPTILFLSGDLERSIYKKGEREFRMQTTAIENRGSLINMGFSADTLSLKGREVPDNIIALVIADPKTTISDSIQARIIRYIGRGGNLMVLGEPGKQYVLNPLLQHIGVQLMDGTLIQPSEDEMPQMITPYLTAAGSTLSEDPILLKIRKTGDSLKELMPGATALAYATQGAFTIHPLLMTVGQQTWLKAGALVTDSAPPVYSPQEGDLKGSFPTALSLTRQVGPRQQRIIVCSDADFLSTLRANSCLLSRPFYSWLDEGQFPVYTPHPNPKDNKLNIRTPGVNALKIVYVWILPGVTLLLGSILLIRRKRK